MLGNKSTYNFHKKERNLKTIYNKIFYCDFYNFINLMLKSSDKNV